MMRKQKGFTLIELLVVIAIIGILASVVLASLNSAREKSRDARRISDVKQLQLALELYFDGSSTYPATASWQTDIAPNYIASVPTDPLGNAYTYEQLTSGTSYVLGGTLEDATHQALDNDIDGTVGTTDCADPVYCIQP